MTHDLIKNMDLMNKNLMNTRMVGLRRNKISGLAAKCDCIILNISTIIYQVSNISKVKTIFIYSKEFKEALVCDVINNLLKKIEHQVVIVIAGSDWTFPNNVDKRWKPTNKEDKDKIMEVIHNKKVNAFFVENLDQDLGDKVHPFPLGINPKQSPVKLKYYLRFINHDIKKILKCTNFNNIDGERPQWKERRDVLKKCSNQWKDLCIEFVNKRIEHETYFKKLRKYQFTICVSGGGLDPCPKLWDAILLGVIPIIKRKLPQTKPFEDLPVVIIDDWTDDAITLQKLKEWRSKYSKFFDNPDLRYQTLKKLTMGYWWKKIKNSL